MMSPSRRLAILEARAQRNGLAPTRTPCFRDPFAGMTEAEQEQYCADVVEILCEVGGETLVQEVLTGRTG